MPIISIKEIGTKKEKTLQKLKEISHTSSSSVTISFLQVILASCLLAICAQIKIPLYFTPVPLTITTPCVLLLGGFLGSRKGPAAVLVYLMQGWIGLPVWAGGVAGISHFFGPTGGYLGGYLLLAYLAGLYVEKRTQKNLLHMFGAFFIFISIQMMIGSIWLAQFVGLENSLSMGFYPFVISELFKSGIAASYLNCRSVKGAEGPSTNE
jgi:biotin transport system substrate-specific component